MIQPSGTCCAETMKVLERIAQSVGMIDANPIEHAAAQPVDQQCVRLLKDMLPLHAQADQRVHVEEAAVPKLLVGRLPVSKPVVLLIQKIVERV